MTDARFASAVLVHLTRSLRRLLMTPHERARIATTTAFLSRLLAQPRRRSHA
jgi:hypothetical protein